MEDNPTGTSSWEDLDDTEETRLIRDAAKGQIEPQQAADKLVEHVRSTVGSEGADGSIAPLFIPAAVYFPIEQHQPLVETLVGIFQAQASIDKGSGREVNQESDQDGPQQHLDLIDEFGMDMNRQWNGFTSKGFPLDQLITHWTRINNFAALLTATSIPELQSFTLYCIWSLREALENPVPSTATADDTRNKGKGEGLLRELAFTIPGAARWIAVRGSQIYASEEEFPPSERGGKPAKGGELWEGKHGFCKGRWELWRRRFGELSKIEGLDAEARKVAAETEAKMKEIESA